PDQKVPVELHTTATIIQSTVRVLRTLDIVQITETDRSLLQALDRGRNEPETEAVLANLARQIGAAAARHKIAQVHVKPLQGPSGAGVSYGLRLVSLLRDPKIGRGLQIESGAKIGILGRYFVSKAAPRTFTVKAELVDGEGETIEAFRAGGTVDD